MSQLNDAILAATGGPTINDGLATWYGKTDDEAINDAEYRWLIEQGAAPATINDMWIDAFGPGQINDVKLAYWTGLALQVLVPNVVGLSLVDATAAIEGAGLVLGSVTGTTDPVVSQDPVSGSLVDPGTLVDVALTAVVSETDLAALSACINGQGWVSSITGPDEITIEGIAYSRAFIDACDYSTITPAPLRIDICDCVQDQGKCLGGCP